MYDASKVIVGLLVFCILMLAPVWLMVGKGPAKVDLYKEFPVLDGRRPTECVEPTAWMRANHMKLLLEWRDKVVREGARIYRSRGFPGKSWPGLSLSGSCLRCHTRKDQFCDRCHTAVGVVTDCFDCHVTGPEGGK